MGANPDILFDDYHHLAELDLRSLRLIICQGMSGCGKTTAIEYLCRNTGTCVIGVHGSSGYSRPTARYHR